MSARETAELLLLLGRLVQAEGYHGDLSPAQWIALRFFARANSFSRTPSAFAEFQATTRGTATQTIKALETGGYLVRQRSEADGRSVSLRLTDKGHEAVARDPFEGLVCAVDSLDAEEQTAMHHALHQVLTTVAARGRIRTSVFARTARTSVKQAAAAQRARPGRPSNACCSALRSRQRMLVSSASIFSPSLATATSELEQRPGLATWCLLSQMSCKTHDAREHPRGLPAPG